jgi:uncharacterized membrane protein
MLGLKPKNGRCGFGNFGGVMQMNSRRIRILLVFVIIFGMAFSGFLTAGVLMSKACPLNGGCTLVLGYPSCMYGFSMYTIMLIILLLTWGEKLVFATGRKLILLVAVVGMLFSGSLLVQEYLNRSPLTICAAGFSMFLLIFLLSLLLWKKD